MKLLLLSDLFQVFSSADVTQPEQAWMIDLESEGISSEVIEQCTESSTGWSGWGFNLVPNAGSVCTAACLLFEQREDAVMAKLVYGKRLYAN